MGVYYWLRVAMMMVSLVLIISVMTNLQNGRKTVGFFSDFFGTSEGESAVDICPTRIVSIETPEMKIYQENLKWYRLAAGQAAEELDAVATEIWFGDYCELSSTPIAPVSEPTVFWTINYVSGPSASLLKGTEGYVFGGAHFQSAELETAARKLAVLPKRTAPGMRMKLDESARGQAK